ncbi:tRNA-splicing endonuclease subunit Sen2 isoform X2 [Pyxicephalus adspersus]|uniref:tRNA-splicing endonuclease subunit Sen2 n=2 Tax=Pyxicephalus adspersus TaxID=30357 RepID=A0AAV2ZWQ2_PYXAD|nr:TPA: hypothetical protein GDO54_016920 [Pyxicephalus adspersus]
MSRSRPEYNIEQGELRGRWKGFKSSKKNLPIISSKKYQLHVEWARSLLEGQGMDRSSADKILEDLCSPFDFPEDKTVDYVDCTSQNEFNFADASFPADQRKEILEGNPLFDPLAKYGSEELEKLEPCFVLDKEALEKMHCHRHDDLILHCGCKPTKQTVQENASEKCKISGEEHEYVWVEEENDISDLKDEDVQEDKNVVKKCKLVCRRNPFTLFEYLQLSREEAFFLVYALGCLSITYRKEPLTILKLWEIFCASQRNFQTSYMAYHHFRSKGWVPKVGLKYGTDLLLYRKGPPFYHASYSVIVELVDSNYEGSPLRPLTWKSLSGLNRTTMNVSKELLICYLIQPQNFTENDMKSPECIKKFSVQEVIVSRWISSQERVEHEEL